MGCFLIRSVSSLLTSSAGKGWGSFSLVPLELWGDLRKRNWGQLREPLRDWPEWWAGGVLHICQFERNVEQLFQFKEEK